MRFHRRGEPFQGCDVVLVCIGHVCVNQKNAEETPCRPTDTSAPCNEHVQNNNNIMYLCDSCISCIPACRMGYSPRIGQPQEIVSEAVEPLHRIQPPQIQQPPQVHAVPSSITPKVANDGHKLIVDKALPLVFQVMQEREWCDKAPLMQAREALRRLDLSGDRFWGSNQMYSRKRTVEDIIASRYIAELRLSM